VIRVLFSWIGEDDLGSGRRGDPGPLTAVLEAGRYDEAHILSGQSRTATGELAERLWERTNVRIIQHSVTLPDEHSTNFGEVHAVATMAVNSVRERSPDASMTFHLSSGTAAMAATWIVLARTRYAANLVQWSEARGVEAADVPFDVSSEFIERADSILGGTASEPSLVALGEAATRGAMEQVLRRAERAALSDVAILLEGDPGVEAEALARFIHERSRRAQARFLSFDCRTIGNDRLDSSLFGQTGRFFNPPFEDRLGQLELADGSTLFLDEIGAIPMEGQARLSRMLSEGELTRVGSTTPIPVDVRIVAGTSRDLAAEVSKGSFLENLYRQLSVAAIRIPSIRERHDELPLLIDVLLAESNARCSAMTPKRLSPEAKNLLLARAWPGNVTQLRTVLTRLVVWAGAETITETDVRQNLPEEPEIGAEMTGDRILGRPFDGGFRMESVLDEVSRSYIERALAETGGVKAKAVELLGMSNATTLTNWMKRLGIEGARK
jgi:DNA-binding NtrC family response regulator